MSFQDTKNGIGHAKVAGTAAFSKFVQMLQQVADTPEPLSLSELCKVSGFPKGTAYRTVHALLAEGLLAESAVTRKIELGPRLLALAGQSWQQSSLRRLAAPHLAELRDKTGETVHLAVFDGQSMVFIDKLESARLVRMSSRIGTRVNLHTSSVGKAYLAFQSPVRRDELVRTINYPWTRFTEKTLPTKQALIDQLEEARTRGWAIDDEEQESGIRCFGAPIFNCQGEVAACVSVTTLIYRELSDPNTAYVEPLQAACRNISNAMRGTP